jgi:hypothetical protein
MGTRLPANASNRGKRLPHSSAEHHVQLEVIGGAERAASRPRAQSRLHRAMAATD